MGQKQSYTVNDPNRQSANSDEVAYDISVPNNSGYVPRSSAHLQQINFRQESPANVAAGGGKRPLKPTLSGCGQTPPSSVDILAPTKEFEACDPALNYPDINLQNYVPTSFAEATHVHPAMSNDENLNPLREMEDERRSLTEQTGSVRGMKSGSSYSNENLTAQNRFLRSAPDEGGTEEMTAPSAVGWIFSSNAPSPPRLPYPSEDPSDSESSRFYTREEASDVGGKCVEHIENRFEKVVLDNPSTTTTSGTMTTNKPTAPYGVVMTPNEDVFHALKCGVHELAHQSLDEQVVHSPIANASATYVDGNNDSDDYDAGVVEVAHQVKSITITTQQTNDTAFVPQVDAQEEIHVIRKERELVGNES